MGFILRFRPLARCLAVSALAPVLLGCGGGGGRMSPVPISVSLANSNVVVMQAGAPVVVQINISSTSETALVGVSGLPAGVAEEYASSDTNPSGTLTFTAAATAKLGTYMPIVNVNSAGQAASATFTLVVEAKGAKP